MSVLLIVFAALFGSLLLLAIGAKGEWIRVVNFLAVGLLFLAAMVAVAEHYKVAVFRHELEATRVTYEYTRAAGDIMERSAIQLDVASMNRRLAAYQYVNSTVWGLWVPDVVDSLAFIR